MLAEDEAPVGAPGEPWVALLPALDPAPMGWQERAWYLGEHRAACGEARVTPRFRTPQERELSESARR